MALRSSSGQPQNVRLRLNYDPQSGPIQINHIQISSEHVLYKGTILRHVIVNLICSLVYLILLLRILKPYLIFRWWPFLADKKNEWSLFFLILLTLLVCLPLFHPGKYIEGADTNFHLCRLSAVAANLNAGLFPPRVELFWLDNIGYGVGFIILLVSTDLFPWQMIQPFLNDIQFTWRLVQTTVIFLSISGGIYVSRFCLTDQITRRVFLVQLLICTIPAVMAVASIRQHRLHDSNEFYLQNHHTYGSEYMFPELSRKYIKENISTLTDNAGNASFSDFRRNDLKIEFAYNENRENEIDFTVPFLYYKGYAAAVRDADDKTMKLSAEAAENGFVRIRGNAPPHGHISVWYDGTIIQKISDIISLLTLTGCILFALRRKRIHL